MSRAAKMASTLSIARALRADVYHIHEPLLIPIGAYLRFRGARVVYDAHEDYEAVAMRVMSERRLEGSARYAAYWVLRRIALWTFDSFIAATPAIARRFGSRCVVVANYPVIGASWALGTAYLKRPRRAVYVGGITWIRGAREMVDAMHVLPVDAGASLLMIGEFSGGAEAVMQSPGWARCQALGWQPREEVARLLSESRLGLVLYHPCPNHTEAQPNKLFEYMDAALPVVASDFPLWRELVEESGCGLVVDPLDPAAIANAIVWMLEHPEEAERMGERGQAAVRTKFNWQQEGRKLSTIYEQLAR